MASFRATHTHTQECAPHHRRRPEIEQGTFTPTSISPKASAPPRRKETAADLEPIIEKISSDHGFDVRGYKRTTLNRRIRKRMADARCATPEDYLARLETDRHEYGRLVNTILINVTEFFRDPPAWEFLQSACVQPLVRLQGSTEPVRVWSAGCATGEEAYSLAMCFAELVEGEPFRRVKLYATDMDETALAVARTGIYGPEDLRNVSPGRLERFFEEVPGGKYRLRREIRSCLIFGQHNVLVDPPISRLDLLVCRNLMIYFDSETQAQLLRRFHYAVRDERYLFLGKAETLMSHSALFRPLEARFRIFKRVPPPPADGPAGPTETRRAPASTAAARAPGSEPVDAPSF